MDKHLLAENPMSDNGDLAIVRTIQPVSIYEIIEGYVEHKSKKDQYYEYQNWGGTFSFEKWEADGRYDKSLDKGLMKHYIYKNSDGEFEEYTLRVHHYFSLDIDTIDESEVFKFMDDAWFWFVAYMKWQDKQL